MQGMMDDGGEDMCSSIDVEGLIFIAKKEVASGDRSGMRSGQIRRTPYATLWSK
jgi:hypothetical protein